MRQKAILNRIGKGSEKLEINCQENNYFGEGIIGLNTNIYIDEKSIQEADNYIFLEFHINKIQFKQ